MTFTGHYPLEWHNGDIQRAVYERAGWRCEHCGMEFVPGTTLARCVTRADGKPMVLTVHHIDGNKANVDWTNLLAVCQRCHLHIQTLWKPGNVLPPEWGVPVWITERGLAYRQVIQHTLFDGQPPNLAKGEGREERLD